MKKIRSVLVANRGEIAIRVFRACNELGIRTVAIYSKEDSLSLHRFRADESYLVGEGKKPVDAYLDIEDIIRIAHEHDVDAIHPGYGFLSENADLAKRCEEEGIIFIGPKVEHLIMFGDKINARIQAKKAGIQYIPGSDGPVMNYAEVEKFAKQVGFPIMLKAVNGGGGRGMRMVDRMADLRDAYDRAKSEAKLAFGSDEIYLEKCIVALLNENDEPLPETDGTRVIFIVGVNGVGKTTTIGKLAKYYKQQGKSVMLAAGDTFRAAASEQLTIWADRVGVPIVKHQEGADAAAVVFDATASAKAKGMDILLVDTAGRLQTKSNLMEELRKMARVASRNIEGAPQETLLVLDATTGQNAVSQAKLFGDVVPLTGVVLTKLDGTAKGGVILSVKRELGVPVRWVGVGEGVDDLRPFDAAQFADALFDKNVAAREASDED